MGKRLFTAIVLLAGLFGAGVLLYNEIFTEDEIERSQRRADAAPLLAVDTSMDARPFGKSVVVSEITGTLERKRPDGSWQAVFVGDVVSKDDALRTLGKNASAVLEIGLDGTAIELAGEFTVPTLTTTLSTVEVVDGTIAARVVPSTDSVLRVASRGSDAIAETKDGDFSVLSTGDGTVAVASLRGSVAVTAAGETVSVNAGKQTVVAKQGPPSPPKTLPPSLLLKVSKTARQLRVRETTVRGRTSPGAIVSIAGVRVHANAHGEFQTKVALKEGRNQLKIVVEDVLGRRLDEDLPTYSVDSKAPTTHTGVEW